MGVSNIWSWYILCYHHLPQQRVQRMMPNHHTWESKMVAANQKNAVVETNKVESIDPSKVVSFPLLMTKPTFDLEKSKPVEVEKNHLQGLVV